MVSFDDAWVKMAVSALSAQRAQFTFSTQGTVTHSKAQGSEAGAQQVAGPSAATERNGIELKVESPHTTYGKT